MHYKFVSYTGNSEDLGRISLGMHCLFVPIFMSELFVDFAIDILLADSGTV